MRRAVAATGVAVPVYCRDLVRPPAAALTAGQLVVGQLGLPAALKICVL